MSEPELIDSTPVELNKFQVQTVQRLYSQEILDRTIIENITYRSDDLTVKGYISRPIAPGRFPLLIWNRGGYKDNGALDNLTAALILASTAAWGYIVAATQYRGNMGGDGEDDLGGVDVNDAFNLMALMSSMPYVDPARVAVEGASRGGITTYRLLARDSRFRCAIVHAGISHLNGLMKARVGFADFIEARFGRLSVEAFEREMARRSAITFAEQFPRTCPLLLMHGTADDRVPLEQSRLLAERLAANGIPHELHEIAGGGHIALKDGSYRQIDQLRRAWLARYL